tara:strand:- start:2740 stop:2934 length:195 start_codon:yes stop_codon:yes gene_type:complete
MMTHDEIFNTMTEREVRYSLDAYQEANRRLQISVEVAEKAFIRQFEKIRRLETEIERFKELLSN